MPPTMAMPTSPSIRDKASISVLSLQVSDSVGALTGSYLSLEPYWWAAPDPGPACCQAHSSGVFGCSSGLSRIPVGRKTEQPMRYLSPCSNASAAFEICATTLDEGSYLQSVVGHCKVEQEVPGIILGWFMNKFYMEKKRKTTWTPLKWFVTTSMCWSDWKYFLLLTLVHIVPLFDLILNSWTGDINPV